MKNIIAVLVMLVLGLAPMAQAFSVPEEVQVVPSPSSTSVVYTETSPSFTIGDVRKAVSRGIGSVNKKIAALKAEILKKDTGTAKSVDALGQKIDTQSGEIKKVGEGVKSLDKKLTDEKNGEFKKLKDNVWSAGAELSTDLKWIAFWVILAVVIVGLAVILILKKSLNRIEEKVDDVDVKIDDIPTDTANMVNAFDRNPLNVTVLGHNVVFLQDEETLNRKVYQILLVEGDVDPTATPADYELQVRSDRKKAEDSLRRTMREHFNGKLATKTDAASLLTVKLIAHYQGTGKLSITPLAP